MKARITITDDRGNTMEGEVELKQAKEAQKVVVQEKPRVSGLKKGSITDKIGSLVNKGFFQKPRELKDMIEELKTKDYHLKSSDLTRPLRTLVRKDLLKRTKQLHDGTKSKTWLYVEP